MAIVQINFELPVPETNRLLDEGLRRGMSRDGSRDSVYRAIIARALMMERLDQVAPVDTGAPVDQEFVAKLGIALKRQPALRRRIEKLISKAAVTRRVPQAV